MAVSSGKMARTAAVGFEFSGPIIVGAVIGHYLDRYFRTDPWLTLILFLLGVLTGFINLIRTLGQFQKEP